MDIKNYIFILSVSLCLCVAQNVGPAVSSPFNRLSASHGEKSHLPADHGPQEKASIRVNTTERLDGLRQKMKEENYSAYIIATDDEHQSEYVAEHDKRRAYISGFSGSAGTAVVLEDKAGLWTDGRYFLQAERQLDSNWILMKRHRPGTPKISRWLAENLSNGSVVGADPRLINHQTWIKWHRELTAAGIVLDGKYKNLVDHVWTENNGRKPPPDGKIFIHQLKYAGESWEEKIYRLRNKLKSEADCMIVTALDEIAWLFNLRGSDIPYHPVFKSFALINEAEIRLYLDRDKLTDRVRQHLFKNVSYAIQLRNYTDIYRDVAHLPNKTEKVLITSKSSYAIYSSTPEAKRIVKDSPILLMKAVKNPFEIEGMKKAHIKDSVAIIDFVALLEEEVKLGQYWDEMMAMERISQCRREQELNMGDSFESISASGSNGAIIHYSSRPATNKPIDLDHMYLLDTGGQYLDGTTDTTRTFHFGNATDFQKETYTRVLMGAIDLASAIFPQGVRDTDIDILARRHLYGAGLEYLHGTGHGIGLFLNVHEGPILIRNPKIQSKASQLKPGMFVSDEPGYYQEDSFGIRLETVVMVTEADPPYRFNNQTFYKFEPVALVPFEPNLIKYHLLDKSQIIWLNDYNLKIRQIVGKELLLQNRTRGYDWMMSRTDPIAVCQPPPAT